jgi:cell division protein ZapA
MAQVTVTINGRTYKMACDDGQEQHLLSLAEALNARVEMLKTDFGQVGDTRLLLMAGVMVTDELGEAKRRNETLEIELQRMKTARETVADRLEAAQDSVARTLTAAAERIERLNGRLRGHDD